MRHAAGHPILYSGGIFLLLFISEAGTSSDGGGIYFFL